MLSPYVLLPAVAVEPVVGLNPFELAVTSVAPIFVASNETDEAVASNGCDKYTESEVVEKETISVFGATPVPLIVLPIDDELKTVLPVKKYEPVVRLPVPATFV